MGILLVFDIVCVGQRIANFFSLVELWRNTALKKFDELRAGVELGGTLWSAGGLSLRCRAQGVPPVRHGRVISFFIWFFKVLGYKGKWEEPQIW